MLIRKVLRVSGAQRALSVALAPWCGRRATHDPGKIVCDVATAVAGRIIRSGRRQRLRLPRDWPWNHLIDTGYAALLAA
ncbi:MAG: hypothetical protein ACRDSK_13195 [Actinophytocola sp.]|uniref:hypothetical protein n=1 Tax=Actinophytocola sp. TaxID=1872138 RepID=UPI003D6BF63A